MDPCNRFATRRGRTAAPFLFFAVAATACGGEPDPTDRDPPRETGSTTDYLVARGRVAAVVTQTNLVADEGESALTVDPDLRNPWGLTFPANGRPWVADNGTGVATVYDPATGERLLRVSIPAPQGGAPPSKPTGVFANADVTAFRGDRFVFVTEDGTISG